MEYKAPARMPPEYMPKIRSLFVAGAGERRGGSVSRLHDLHTIQTYTSHDLTWKMFLWQLDLIHMMQSPEPRLISRSYVELLMVRRAYSPICICIDMWAPYSWSFGLLLCSATIIVMIEAYDDEGYIHTHLIYFNIIDLIDSYNKYIPA